MSDFLQSVKNNVKSREREIFQNAMIEELTKTLRNNPTLDELSAILNEANNAGFLNGIRLNQVLPNNAPSQRKNAQVPNRITEEERDAGMKSIALILADSNQGMTKTDVFEHVEDERLKAKWPSIIKAMRRAGFVVDNGEQRNKKAYQLTTEGQAWVESQS